MSEVAFWNPKAAAGEDRLNGEKQEGGIERTSYVPDVDVAARYQHEVTIHQGRIERILEENLHMYAGADTIRRSHRFLDFRFDSAADTEFPILVSLEAEDPTGQITQKSVRAKYLIGGDGARSRVRKSMGLQLVGETTDHIWGVVDFVARTDFPDIRRRCAIHSDAGSIMVIPREQISTGEYLTRLYVQVADEVVPDVGTAGGKKADALAGREKRAAITLEYIFSQARKVFAPYTIGVKEGTTVDWWAAYQIGQRMTPEFSACAPDGRERVFIVGDGIPKSSFRLGFVLTIPQHATPTAPKPAKA
jgi:phenol 2-monooxygenase